MTQDIFNTMNIITKTIKVKLPQEQAFDRFLNHLNEWWPKAYTWSNQVLEEIKIEPFIGGLCSETGPHGFRCDWGSVIDLIAPERIHLKWQISPERVPEPDAAKASDVEISFRQVTEAETTIELQHFNFENHQKGSQQYYEEMDSARGWEFILHEFTTWLEDKKTLA